MPRSLRPQVTYDRLLKEARDSLRTCRAILQVDGLPEEARILTAGLIRQMERCLSRDIPAKRRR